MLPASVRYLNPLLYAELGYDIFNLLARFKRRVVFNL